MAATTPEDKNRRKKKGVIAVGIAAAAAALVAIGAGTFAAFSDTEDATVGDIKAGTLDLTVGGTTAGVLFDEQNLVPGYTDTKEITFHNVGSLPGIMDVEYQVTGLDNTCTEPEDVAGGCSSSEGDLADAVQMVITDPDHLDPPLFDGTLAGLEASQNTEGPVGTLEPDQELSLTITFTVPLETTGNEIQSDSILVTSVATLDQAT